MKKKDLFYLRNRNLLNGSSLFKNTNDFNYHMRRVYYTFKDDLKETLKEFAKFLSQYAVKIAGVTWMKVETMAKKFGKSVPTIKRYLRELKKLGIIARIEPENGSHYITYFKDDLHLEKLPEEEADSKDVETPDDTPEMIHQENAETPCESKAETQFSEQETGIIKAKLKSKNINKRYKENVDTANSIPEQLDHTFTPSSVDPLFVQEVKPYFDNAETIKSIWERAVLAARKLGLNVDGPQNEIIASIATKALKDAIYRYKSNAIKNSLFGYYYGIVRNKIKEYLKRQERNNKITCYVYDAKGDDTEYVEVNEEPTKESESMSDHEAKLFIDRNFRVKKTQVEVVRDMLIRRGVEYERVLRLINESITSPMAV